VLLLLSLLLPLLLLLLLLLLRARVLDSRLPSGLGDALLLLGRVLHHNSSIKCRLLLLKYDVFRTLDAMYVLRSEPFA
jgi:hypothetical protein